MADFTFVTDRVATGAAVSSVEDVEELWRAGVSHIIDCRDDFDDLPLLLAHYKHRYCWNGTADDGQHKSATWFSASVSFATRAIRAQHGCVYAHCAAGINRGPSTAYMILRALGIGAAEAENMIRVVRPQVGLAYKADADAAYEALYMRRVRDLEPR